MAHADYDCCAVCDSAFGYQGSQAESKGTICGPCVANMAREGHIVGTPAELIAWIRETPSETVAHVLKKVGYSRCFYPNPVDEEWDKKPTPTL